ncbi:MULTISPECIES: hypothetical protein [unclassified Streptomyces]|uniref:hypothetical protein n=1 Tax=unclassified Streptomyces TaxID=2593676 RepID=UPI0036F8B1A9
MHSEHVIEEQAVDGPVFVDTSGRRARLLRRLGLLVGVACLGYAAVLVLAFMGWGTSLTPSSLLPFGGRAGAGQGTPGDVRPYGGAAPTAIPDGTAAPEAIDGASAPGAIVGTSAPGGSAPTAAAGDAASTAAAGDAAPTAAPGNAAPTAVPSASAVTAAD